MHIRLACHVLRINLSNCDISKKYTSQGNLIYNFLQQGLLYDLGTRIYSHLLLSMSQIEPRIIVHSSDRFATSTGSLLRRVHYSDRFTTPTGSLLRPVHCSDRFTTPTGSLLRLVHCSDWFTTPTGSLLRLVHYSDRFTTPTGSLFQPVLPPKG